MSSCIDNHVVKAWFVSVEGTKFVLDICPEELNIPQIRVIWTYAYNYFTAPGRRARPGVLRSVLGSDTYSEKYNPLTPGCEPESGSVCFCLWRRSVLVQEHSENGMFGHSYRVMSSSYVRFSGIFLANWNSKSNIRQSVEVDETIIQLHLWTATDSQMLRVQLLENSNIFESMLHEMVDGRMIWWLGREASLSSPVNSKISWQ